MPLRFKLAALLIGRFHLLRDARPLDEARQTLALEGLAPAPGGYVMER